jgi:hypothetical protein
MWKTIFAAVLLLLSSVAMADTIYLHDGQAFAGKIVAQNEDSIIIETYDGRSETIGRRFIERIERDGNRRTAKRRGYRYSGSDEVGRNEWIFKLGLDFLGTHETSNSNLFIEGSGNGTIDGTQKTGAGLSFGSEYVGYVTDNLGLGGGLTLQSLRGLADGSGNFNFFPLYGMVKLRTTPARGNVYEYIVGQLGYNFFGGDYSYRGGGTLDGGLYYGVGAGIMVHRIQLELLYSVDHGSAGNSGYIYDDQNQAYDYFKESGDITYSKIGLNIGFLF